jgi:hypothetical protein
MRAQASFVMFVAICGFVMMAGGASAGIVQTNSLDTSSIYAFPVSNNDLIEDSATFDYSIGFTPQIGAFANFTNGTMGDATTATMAGWTGAVHDAFFFLKGSGTGYDVSAINIYTGWGDSRKNHSYGIYYLLTGETYVSGNLPHQLGSTVFEWDANGGSGSNNQWSAKVSLTDTTGTVLSGIKGIQFKFITGAGGGTTTAYREIDILGSASVPEPSGIVLIGTALCGLLAYAWRKRR